MAYEAIIYEKVEDRIVRVTLNRPEKLNAMSRQLLSELDGAFDEFENDAGASVLIIRGAGRAFCAGYDLQPVGSSGGFTVTNDRWGLRKIVARWQRLWNLPKPTIAQVHGYCLAGATELVGHCDIVFASDDAQFGHPAGRSLGVLPTLSLWPYLIGMRKTKEYLFTGDSMTAQEALENGLVNRVCPREKLEEEVLAYARRVAMVPVDLLTLHKAATNRFFEIMGMYAAEQSALELDVIAHQTVTVKNEVKKMAERGLKEALRDRDKPFVAKKG
jgi:enoyl-CoA hydratase